MSPAVANSGMLKSITSVSVRRVVLCVVARMREYLPTIGFSDSHACAQAIALGQAERILVEL